MVLKRNALSVALASAILMVASGARAQTATPAVSDETLMSDFESSDRLIAAAPAPDATDATDASDAADAADAADAQDATEPRRTREKQLEQVEVVGIRAGIESAIGVKREETSIVEVVSAEDIGKLPDISIADSIARLPGLTAQRVAGRSSTISIRGLSGDYGTTLMNGREQVSVGDNRTVEFDQFPSELINQVVVYKTPDASLVGQGLSGTVDLRTIRPLSFTERVASINLRGEKNSLGKVNPDSDDYGSRVSAFYVDQFLDDRLGIALGYARLDSPGQAERYETYGFPTDINGAGGNFVIGGTKVMASSTENVRQGLMGALEFNVNDQYTTMLDLYYSKFEKTETTRFLEAGLGWSASQLQPGGTIEDGVVTSGTFTNVRPVVRNDLNEGDDKLFAIGWNHEFRFSEDWKAKFDISYSKADRQESLLETYAGTRAGVFDTVNFTDTAGSGFPNYDFGIDYTDPSVVVLTDPGGWGQDGYIKTPQVDDRLQSARLDFERSFLDGPFTSLEFGINFADREKTRRVPEAFLDLITDETTVPASFLYDSVDLSHGGVPGSLSYDINGVVDQFYTRRNNINADIVNKQWTVEEQTTTAYVQLNIATDWGAVPIRGNVGVQAVNADQSSRGFSVIQGDAANAVPFDGGADYTDYLPSMNLSFELPSDNIIRFALARQMARPRIDQMRANNNTSLEFSGVNQGLWIRNGGNPELEPWKANAVDLAWEKYFGNRAYIGLAYFYKDLRTYVYDQVGFFDASGFAIPDGYEGPPPEPVGFYTRPANGEGGNLKGWEFTLSLPFDLFTPALEGFGLVANYSDTDSSIKRLGPEGPDEPIAGLSDKVQNISIYYEKYGFQARLSQRKRSDFLGEIQGFGADRALVAIDGESVLDAQVGYTFREGNMFEGASILLQVNNLTNEPYRQYYPQNGLTQRYESYGRQYLLGVTYRF